MIIAKKLHRKQSFSWFSVHFLENNRLLKIVGISILQFGLHIFPNHLRIYMLLRLLAEHKFAPIY